jgi:hypothetical protein
MMEDAISGKRESGESNKLIPSAAWIKTKVGSREIGYG